MAALSIVSPNKLDSGMYLTNGAGDLITPQPQQQQSQQQGSPAPAAKMSSGKRTRCSSENGQSTPELLRCKRRINFGQLGYSLPQAPPAAVARRNERERNRVKLVNMGFATLRDHVPNGAKNKKMSKVETLRSAVDYIRQLQQLLHENDSAMMSNASYEAAQGLSQLAEAAGLGAGHSENCYPRSSANSGVYSQSLSPACSVASSPTPSYASDSSSYEALSPEDEELLDFTSWFS